MSSFAWIDNSTEDRRRVLDAIEQLKESDARDELGLATVRDGFANTLFPGTGTLQTRAGYFLFVPWMYRALHKKGVSSEAVETAARKEEIRLISALLECDDSDGTIGRVAREQLKRLPSSVYWNGLRTWRIFEHDLTLEEYHRTFESFDEEPEGARDDERQFVEGHPRRDWHPALPEAPEGFPRVTSFTLRKRDREYLAERITLSVGSSLLAWLLRNAQSLDGDAPWEHPQTQAFPKPIQETLHHARCFSDAMHGAPLLYNLMLAEQLQDSERRTQLIERYRDALTQWAERLKPQRAALAEWTLREFWSFVRPLMRVTPATMRFVEDWVQLRGWMGAPDFAESRAARELIRRRERQLKGPRARLDNPRALELWNQDSGIARLTYRWGPALRILRDLRPELSGHAES